MNFSETVSEGGLGTAVTVSGGEGFGGSLGLNAGTGGVAGSGTIGIGLGFNVTSGYHLYNRIFTCPEDSSEDNTEESCGE